MTEGGREGGCGHGIIKLALITVVRIVVQRKRRWGEREVDGAGAVPSRPV